MEEEKEPEQQPGKKEESSADIKTILNEMQAKQDDSPDAQQVSSEPATDQQPAESSEPVSPGDEKESLNNLKDVLSEADKDAAAKAESKEAPEQQEPAEQQGLTEEAPDNAQPHNADPETEAQSEPPQEEPVALPVQEEPIESSSPAVEDISPVAGDDFFSAEAVQKLDALIKKHQSDQ